MCWVASKCCNILKWYTKVQEYLPSQVTNFCRMKSRSCHCRCRTLRGTPSFQSTSIFLSMMKRCHRFLSSFWFLNHYSLVFSKLVVAAINSSVTSNFRGPILLGCFLNFWKTIKPLLYRAHQTSARTRESPSLTIVQDYCDTRSLFYPTERPGFASNRWHRCLTALKNREFYMQHRENWFL